MESIIAIFSDWSYLGVVATLSAGGYILPIPEEVFVMTVGYLSSISFFTTWIALTVSYVCIFTADMAVFFLARAGVLKIDALHKRIEHSHLIEKFRLNTKDSLSKTILVMRFVPGMRFVAPLMAVIHGASPLYFATLNLLALAVYTPIWFFLGYFFSDNILNIIFGIEIVKHSVFSIVALVIAVLIMYWVYATLVSKRKSKS